MKHFVTLVLALAMLLSMCACTDNTPATTTSAAPSEDQPSNQSPSSTKPTQSQPTQPSTTVSSEPTQEELKAMWEYAHIASTLKSYLENGYIFYSIYDENETVVETLRDQDALQYCYQQLVAMESIDRWIGTEYTEGIHWRDEIPVWDRSGMVNGFKVLRDRKLRQDYVLTKKDGSIESGTESSWSYNADGTLTAVDGIQKMFETVQSLPVFVGNFEVYFSYNDNGTYSQILYGSNAYGTATPTYDADGNMTSMAVVSRDDSCTVTYAYSGGRVTRIAWTEYDNPFEIEYTYDGNGNVSKSVYTEYTPTDNLGNNMHIHHRIIMEYTYSGTQLRSATCTEQNWNWEWDEDFNYVFFKEIESTDNYSFSHDGQGRLAAVDISYGDKYWTHGDKAGTLCREPEYKSKHITFVYGNYYFYYG